MAYFNHSFCKSFLATDILLPAGTQSSALQPGEIIFASGTNWGSQTSGTMPVGALGYIIQGSYHTNDTIGNNPGHGGYTESVKSKGINPRYLTRLYSTVVQTPVQATSAITVGSDCVPCDQPLFIRVDIKGSPALRFLNRNSYAIADSDGACCSVAGQEFVDPALALAQAAQRLLDEPVVKPFIAEASGGGMVITGGSNPGTYTIAQVLDGTYTPSTDPVTDGIEVTLNIVGAYVETKFGNCSFDTRDFYGKEPVQISMALVDDTGLPCRSCGTVVNTPGVMPQTSGETVLRSILMTENYMQSPFNQGNRDSARIRQIEGSDDILAAVSRNTYYKTYVIQHSIPFLSNPTGVFNNDQYLYKIYVDPAATDGAGTLLTTKLDALMTDMAAWASANGNNIAFQPDIDQ